MDSRLFRLAGAEFLGTFLLVFLGMGAIVVDGSTGVRLGPAGTGISFGLAVMMAVWLCGQVSGAHINPVVTLALAGRGVLPWSLALLYLPAQLLGATTASAVLRVLFGDVADLGGTLSDVSELGTLAIEFGITFLLVLVVIAVVTSRVQPVGAATVIGGYVALAAIFAGPVTGASMNPARSLGPALVSGVWDSHWVYWVGPMAGAAVAVFVRALLSGKERVSSPAAVLSRLEG
jgi:MIP family channel proteins